MPQDKFITRRQAGIREGRVNFMMGGNDPANTASTPSEQIVNATKYAKTRQLEEPIRQKHRGRFTDAYRADMKAIEPQKDALRIKANNDRRIAMNDDVTSRDATNARVARERLASRTSSAAKVAGGALASGMAKGLGVAGVMAATQKAAGATPSQERAMMKATMSDPNSFYNTRGPGSVKRPAYAGQSTVSKLMGVGRNK